MEKFLEQVAADLWSRYGERVGELRVILPNVRTRVFFVDALSRIASKPIWAPEYLSIDALMVELSGLGRVDQIVAITELYKIYAEYHQGESFDSFYHWGEVLLGDYDAVDKYLIDAPMLFANVADLKDVDAALEDYLDEEQIMAIRRFWREFEPGKRVTDHKEKFLTVWRTLLPVYERLRERLEQMGVGYSGMIYRRAADLLREGSIELPKGDYVVIGFNALSAAEKVLFDHLHRVHSADFYWDWDEYYLRDDRQEAGLFMRENLKRYPAPASFRLESHFAEPKEMRVVSTASNSLQCKYVAEFVEEVLEHDGHIDKNTAIVLTDENLLSPLLYSLPDTIGQVNVTMGYPLRATLVYSFTERLLQLQLRSREGKAGRAAYYHKDVEGLLSHPFVAALDGQLCRELREAMLRRGRMYVSSEHLTGHNEELDAIFRRVADWHYLREYLVDVLGRMVRVAIPYESDERRALRREAYGLVCEAIVKCDNSAKRCDVEMRMATYVSLLRRLMQSIRIPYSGEPLSGVQVMGILETRNLDFDNVVVLSMNDDNFPSGRLTDLSFIPYNLRFAYGLPTPRHNEGVYAYYFYRLLQRARRVDMVYCSVATDAATGEQSRYIYQLDFESPHHLNRIDKSLNVGFAGQSELVVPKTESIMRRLDRFLREDEKGGRGTISPSAFNNYLECPLKFYYRSVAGLRVDDEIEESVDDALFGTIFHKAMKLLYDPMTISGEPPKSYLPKVTPEQIHEAVVRAIAEDYFSDESVTEDEYGGNLRIVADTVEKYVKVVVGFDAARDVSRVYRLEKSMGCEFEFAEGKSVIFEGIADRIDLLADGSLRIIDYKTGSLHKEFAHLADILALLPKERYGAMVQTLIYSMIAERMQAEGKLEGRGATPSLYYVRYMHDKEYSPLLNDKSRGSVSSYGDYREEFEAGLRNILSDIFSSDVLFVATNKEDSCKMCDFKTLCRRNKE